MNNIKLPNRDGSDVVLEFLKESKETFEFLLEAKWPNGEELPVWIHRQNRKIYAVDPCGGPFIGLGYVIKDLKLVQIRNVKEQGLTLFFKKNETEERSN